MVKKQTAKLLAKDNSKRYIKRNTDRARSKEIHTSHHGLMNMHYSLEKMMNFPTTCSLLHWYYLDQDFFSYTELIVTQWYAIKSHFLKDR